MFIECHCSVSEIYATLSALIGCMEMVISWIMFPNSGKYGRWALSGQHLANPSAWQKCHKSKAAKLPICPPMGSDWDKMARRIEGRLIDIDKTWPFNVNLIVGRQNKKCYIWKMIDILTFPIQPPTIPSQKKNANMQPLGVPTCFYIAPPQCELHMWMFIYIRSSPPLLLW